MPQEAAAAASRPPTSPAPPAPRARRATILSWVGGTVVILLALRFWLQDAFPYFEITEAAYGRFWPRRGWLLLHVVGGSVALLMGPFQFWTGLRKRHLRVHRWTGRSYLAGVAVGAAASIQLAFRTEVGWTFGVGLFMLAMAWIVTTGMALAAISRRRINAHRDWMARSYIVTFAFVSFRILFELDVVRALGTAAEVATTVSWVCWVVPLFLFEVVLLGRREGIFGR